MQTVRLTKALDGFQSGQTLTVDPNSAAALIARGDAEPVAEAAAEPPATADEDPAPTAVLTRQSPKPELVEFAIGAGWPREQAEGSTRAQIADAFGLE